MIGNVGLKYSPILEEADKRLGLGEYAAALSQLINQAVFLRSNHTQC